MLPGHPRVVDAHQFAKFQPVIFRNRLDAPLVPGGVLALGTGIALLPDTVFSFALASLPAGAATASMLLLAMLMWPSTLFAQQAVPVVEKSALQKQIETLAVFDNEYRHRLASFMHAQLRALWAERAEAGEVPGVEAFLPGGPVGAPDKSWQAVLSARNIRDKEDNVSGLFVQDSTNVRTPLPPAELMLTFRLNY